MAAPTINGWILLTYRLPSDPGRSAARIKRQLKTIGALPVRDGFAIMPATPASEPQVAEFIGWANALFDGAVDVKRRDDALPQAHLVLAFNTARNAEYGAVTRGCEAFLRRLTPTPGRPPHIDSQRQRSALARLQRRVERIDARNHLDASGRQSAVDALARCAEALGRFESAGRGRPRVPTRPGR